MKYEQAPDFMPEVSTGYTEPHESALLRRFSLAIAPAQPRADLFLELYGKRLILFTALLIPLKLAIGYFALIPLLLAWLLSSRRAEAFRESAYPVAPLYLFIICAIVLAPLGINPLRSIPTLLSLAFFSCIIFCTAWMCRRGETFAILAALLCGQTVASIHSILAAANPNIPEMFIGTVSESGQLALTVPLTFALLLQLEKAAGQNRKSQFPLFAWSFCNTSLALATGFSPVIFPDIRFAVLSGIALAVSLTLFLYRGIRKWSGDLREAFYPFCLVVVLPLIGTGLLVNLKRGPWAGVGVAGVFLLFHLKRKLLLPFVACALIIAIFIDPVKTRIVQSSDHFFISGGRSQIWNIGAELSTRYPLGLGFDNSRFMRNYSQEIPPELKHFHNTPLNILVETGWIGLSIFLWWVAGMLKLAFDLHKRGRKHQVLALGICSSLISWQTAGLVEYNFGDSEVLLIAFILIGTLLYLREESQKSEPASAI